MKGLREFCLKEHISALWQAQMADHTSFRIGGKADALLFPDTEEGLVKVLGFIKREKIPFRVIGNATNLLISDEGYRGALISTRHIRSVSVSGQTARASSGAPINTLCRTLADFSLSGTEHLYGIPGTVGGGVYMNAGAFDRCIADVISFLSVYNLESGRTEVIRKEDADFGYRDSILKRSPHLILLSADLTLIRTPSSEIRETMRRVLSSRMEKQPTALPSAGSAFLRPKDGYAGRLIEEAGLSGARVGGAAVSLKHAGFIVNLGGATAEDVLALMTYITETVQKHSGITLVPEIEYIHHEPDRAV